MFMHITISAMLAQNTLYSIFTLHCLYLLPEINNSQNTLVRFYIVSNTEEVLPLAMSE